MTVRRASLVSGLAATAVLATLGLLPPTTASAEQTYTNTSTARRISTELTAGETQLLKPRQQRLTALRTSTTQVNGRRARIATPAPSPTAVTPTTVAPAPVPAPVEPTAPALTAEARALVLEQAEWTMRAVLPGGAIASYVDRRRVDSYLGSFAAWGLARATATTGDTRYAAAAWRWAEWYAAHMDGNGFVTDYDVAADLTTLTSTGGMDSTDAYAGLFVVALDAAATAAPDAERLRRLTPAVGRALDAMNATMMPTGLTGATPQWMVAYLMDQAEVYAGMRAAVAIAERVGDVVLADRARRAAEGIRVSVERLWNPATQSYDWAVHDTGVRDDTDWSRLYPDALQQVWAVAFGFATGDRATALLSRFQAEHPEWSTPTASSLYNDGPRVTGYWPMTLTAMRATGGAAAVPAAARSIVDAGRASGYAWPYTTAIAGQVVLGLTG